MATKTESLTLYPASVDTATYSYASVNSSYPLTNPIGKNSSSTTYSQWNLKTGSRATSYVFYKFDCSNIPQDATINSVSCSAKGYISQTNSQRVATRQMQMYYGTTTAKGSAVTVSTSTSAQNITCGSWSRTELNDIRIRCYAVRGTSNTTTNYYQRFYGATLTISYTYNAITYTVTSSVTGNGTIDPEGTIDVSNGDSYTLMITPASEDASIEVLDNGVNVTNLVEDATDGPFTVTTKQGASYGFQKDYDNNCVEGWWQSTNKGRASTASVSTVTFTCVRKTSVTIRYICYAESTYDYFLVSQIDESLNTNASADSSAAFTTKNSNSSSEQSFTFDDVPAGTHTFDVKYFKDSYTDSNWDSAQFTVEFDPVINGGSKQYTIDSVNSNHVIQVIITTLGTKKFYMKKNNSWVEIKAIYIKTNGSWVAQNLATFNMPEGLYIYN